MTISPITKAQWLKVAKAIAYSFVSAAIATLLATGLDLSKKTLVAVLVAGINGALVTIKQLFTQP